MASKVQAKKRPKEVRVVGSEHGLMKAIDGNKKGDMKTEAEIQTGFVTPPLPIHQGIEIPPENLSPTQILEKGIYQRIIHLWLPEFPANKLQKQRLDWLKEFFDVEVQPLIHDTLLERLKDLSP